jgi:threonine synthase
MSASIPPHFYQCISCKRRFEPEERVFTCPDCGPRNGTLDVMYHDIEQVSAPGKGRLISENQGGHWRYRNLLPIPLDADIPAIPVGDTPLFRARRLEQLLGCRAIYLKDDTRNPSGSLKDRASSVAVCHALWQGYSDLATASTGNAGISLAFWAAAFSASSHVFVPERATDTALAMLGMFGAKVYRVSGSYDQAFEQCGMAVERFGWYNRNTGINPVLGEGKKTAALEIAESMAGRPPDAVVVAVGDGCIFGGLWKGFQDARKLGWIGHAPRLYGIQSQGADPLARAFQSGSESFQPVEPQTVADSIAVGNPRDAMKALRAARESGGALISVPDEAMLEAQRMLGREVPIFVEPASAASLAGLQVLLERGDIQRSEHVVLVMTGTGLKDIPTAKKAVQTHIVDIGTSVKDLGNITHQ